MDLYDKIMSAFGRDILKFRIEEDGRVVYSCRCPKDGKKCNKKNCGICKGSAFDIYNYKWLFRKRMQDDPCILRTPDDPSQHQHKSSGTYIEKAVWDILEEVGADYIKNDRSVLKRKELDVYIPEHNAAIECNGMFWHSTVFKPEKSHHNKKWKACNQKNIKLLSLWEDWFLLRPEAVKAAIIRVSHNNNTEIPLKNCRIHKYSKTSKDIEEFMETYNLQGPCKMNVAYGIEHDGEIIAAMCFSRASRRGSRCWLVGGIALKTGIKDINIFQTVFDAFCEEMEPNEVRFDSPNDDPTIAETMKSLGFRDLRHQKTYTSFLIDPSTFERYNASLFDKEELMKRLKPYGNVPKEWSAIDIMTRILSFHHINDTGRQCMIFEP